MFLSKLHKVRTATQLFFMNFNFIPFLNSHLQILYNIRCCCVTLVWLFSTMCYQMSPQTVCTRRCIVTLVTFVWFFSAVRFQMCPQIACPRECKVTLVAFVWFFSTACFQRSLQNYCPRGRNLKLVAFV